MRTLVIVQYLFWLLVLMACKPKSHHGKFSPEQIEKFRNEFKLPATDSYVLDSSYLPYLLSLEGSVDSGIIKNHYQPLQAMYFNQNGDLVSFHVNCYAGLGVKDRQPLNWNQNNAFNKFVPNTVAPLDTLFKFGDLVKYINGFDGQKIDTIGLLGERNVIVVFWSKSILENDARSLIELVQNNSKAAKAKIIYVNTDNMLR